LPSKVPYFKVKAGEKLISTGPSGGGYGDPSLRAPEAVARDVADGLISEQTAQRLFSR
jgi:N-methylhydantoinase B